MANIKFYAAIVLLCVSILFVGFIPKQNDFSLIFVGFSVSFLSYFWLIKKHLTKARTQILFGLAAILPLLVLFSFPNLSDDIYRFIWDGYCSLSGISPYDFTPRSIPFEKYNGLNAELFDKLNSPDYFSIYPAVSQLLFAMTTWLSDSILMQSFILKFVYLVFHLLGGFAIFKVFKEREFKLDGLLYYYLNPLVLVEGLGNLHAEINMVSFLFMALYFWQVKKDTLSALFFSIAISVKLIPIFFLGYFLIRYKKSRHLQYLLKVGGWTVLLFVPVLFGLITGGFLDSIDLYFRKFEFNASLYYVLRQVGMWISGYNLISYLGPLLFLSFVSYAFYKWFKEAQINDLYHFVKTNESILIVYLLISTIIHPWYLIPLLGINVFLRRKYLIVWSFLITLTYINYSYTPYHENLKIVFIEYSIVAWIAYWEFSKSKKAAINLILF